MSEKDKNRRKKMTMQIIQDQIPQELSGRMTKQSLERLANHLHLATQNEMGDIPLWLLWDLAITCKQLDLKENYQKVLVEIQMNLETQHKADLAEQRAEKAEQRLKEAKLLEQRITNFINSMTKKYQAS
ncbi:hypothetical protein AT922_00490 [Campylobacter jejuni]|nr:hypothetical protein BLD34_09390 [Campylobacter jejuni]KJD26529.1 hypothetical protein TM44_06485 [Campylobacter jejuni subsp. jejuni]KJD28347.1 hypothetical protein TM43_05405 [Campylobacter jejuni subsp. jejuni]KJD29001.1 hypothetical protein TM46_08020 [Campylobacter jejuni subsp. jejuni]KJD98175.1 hypothetical protein TM45_01840 [Campylobacter jejuni subsp. jejuni]